jgi:hypothetical protein
MRRGEEEEDYQGLGGEGSAPTEQIERRLRRRRSGSGGDRAAVREEERGEVRDEEEMLLPLYRSEGEREDAR